MKVITISLTLFYLVNSVFLAFASTGIGNGGDTLDSFLQMTRSALYNVLSDMKEDLARGEIFPKLCDIPELSTLDQSQKELCGKFVLEALNDWINMNYGQTSVLFKISKEGHTVPDPEGRPRPVKAWTEHDPKEPIFYHYDGIKNLQPKELLTLMAHEFGHKVIVPSITHYLTDNEPVGPFSSPGGGRQLLDSAARAVSALAVKKNRIGEVFGLTDYFLCNITIDEWKVSPLPATLRYFPFSGNFDVFESGIGRTPQDISQCYVTFSNGEKILLQTIIHEENGCDLSNVQANRWTLSRLWKIFPDPKTDPVVLQEKMQPQWNPICQEKPNEHPISLETHWGASIVKFDLRYLFSKGSTHSTSLKKSKQFKIHQSNPK